MKCALHLRLGYYYKPNLLHMEKQFCGAQSDTVDHNIQVTDIHWQCTPEEIDFKPKTVEILASIKW